jgi:hypothetical protein
MEPHSLMHLSSFLPVGILHNTILQQVNMFTYLGPNLSYEEEKDVP